MWCVCVVCLRACGVCLFVCVCVEEPRGKSKYTTCTKYTISSVKPGCMWLPLNLKKCNIRIGIAKRFFFNLFIRSQTKHSASFIGQFRLREHYSFLFLGVSQMVMLAITTIQFLRCLGLKDTRILIPDTKLSASTYVTGLL